MILVSQHATHYCLEHENTGEPQNLNEQILTQIRNLLQKFP